MPTAILSAIMFLLAFALIIGVELDSTYFNFQSHEELYRLTLLLALLLGSILGFTAAAISRWKYSRSVSPIQQRLKQFTTHLLQRNPVPIACKRGPARGVSVNKLTELLNFFSDFIRDRTAYYLNSNITKPLTKSYQCSFSELTGPESLKYFVSHFWGTAFSHFVETIVKHAKDVAKARGFDDWGAITYWVCFLSNNQWMVLEELGNGQWQESSFYQALRSDHCNATCMVLDTKALPLTRSWCLFEILQTYRIQNERDDFQGLQLCTAGGLIGSGECYDTDIALARRLASLSVADAKASNQSDEQMIADLVQVEGGTEVLNNFIRENVSVTLEKAQEKYLKEISEVRFSLTSTVPTLPMSNISV